MARIDIPEIPENISTLESALAWIKRLELVQERLERELANVKAALKYVVRPKYHEMKFLQETSKKEASKEASLEASLEKMGWRETLRDYSKPPKWDEEP